MGYPNWPHGFDRIFTKEKLENSFAIKSYFILPGIASIVGGLVFIILAIKLLLGK